MRAPLSGLDIGSRRAFGSRPQRLQFEFIRLDGPSETTELGTIRATRPDAVSRIRGAHEGKPRPFRQEGVLKIVNL